MWKTNSSPKAVNTRIMQASEKNRTETLSLYYKLNCPTSLGGETDTGWKLEWIMSLKQPLLILNLITERWGASKILKYQVYLTQPPPDCHHPHIVTGCISWFLFIIIAMKPPKISIKVSIYQYPLQYWPIVGSKWYRYLSAWELDCLLIYWYWFLLNLKYCTGFRNSTSPSTCSFYALVSRSNHGPDMSTPRSRQSPSSHYHRLMAASSDTGSDFGSCESYLAWALWLSRPLWAERVYRMYQSPVWLASFFPKC